jgi:hypothetical protein
VVLLAAATTGDPSSVVPRLNRCRTANCGLIHRVDGRATCVGRGSRCQWLSQWAAFLAGDGDCPHWPQPSRDA